MRFWFFHPVLVQIEFTDAYELVCIEVVIEVKTDAANPRLKLKADASVVAVG